MSPLSIRLLCGGLAVISYLGTGESVKAKASLPVQATLSSDRTRAEVGESFRVTFTLVALQDMPEARASIRTKGCATETPQPTGRLAVPLRKDESVTLSAVFRLITEGECHVFAELVNLETPGVRLASVYSVTINQAPTPAIPGLKHGTTGQGQRTIEAPAARQ